MYLAGKKGRICQTLLTPGLTPDVTSVTMSQRTDAVPESETKEKQILALIVTTKNVTKITFSSDDKFFDPCKISWSKRQVFVIVVKKGSVHFRHLSKCVSLDLGHRNIVLLGFDVLSITANL